MSSDEKILLRRAIDGDIECFEQLIEKYQIKAYNIAFRILGNEEDAKDATQDAFIKIYHALRNFRGDSSFYTWIYRIVTNTCYDFLKKRNKMYNISSLTNYDNSSEGELEDIPDESYEPEQIFDQKENITSVIECMKLLSTDHKTVLVLRDIQGFSYEDISEILNCSVGTVKSRINRARFKLKEIIVSSMEHI